MHNGWLLHVKSINFIVMEEVFFCFKKWFAFVSYTYEKLWTIVTDHFKCSQQLIRLNNVLKWTYVPERFGLNTLIV